MASTHRISCSFYPPFLLVAALLLALLFHSSRAVTTIEATSDNDGECGWAETKSGATSAVIYGPDAADTPILSAPGAFPAGDRNLREEEARAVVAAEERARLAERRAKELDAELRAALGNVARLEDAVTQMEEHLAMAEKRCGEKRAEAGRQLKACIGERERAKVQLHECAFLAAREEQG
ncbi:hypothetical protein CLOP_g12782 [Closterium sp. NIES-67]|nr:hypothetical protein CLOP_g12782 [Closterium sp. NIES-67]